MKKILRPSSLEEAVYYSDFSGKCFGNLPPPVVAKIEFNYGSKQDGESLEFHFTDEEWLEFYKYLQSKFVK